MIYGYWFQVLTDDAGVLPKVDENALKKLCDLVVREEIERPGDRLKLRQKMIEGIREGDTVLAPCLARFAQDMEDLFEAMELLVERRGRFGTLDIPEKLYEGGAGPTMLLAVARFEKAIRRAEARREAATVRMRGRNGGRPRAEKSAINQALRLYDRNQLSIKEITEKTGVSKSTLYKYIALRRMDRAKKIPSAAEEDPNSGKG